MTAGERVAVRTQGLTKVFRGFRAVLRGAIKLRLVVLMAAAGGLILSMAGFGLVSKMFFPNSSRPQVMVDIWLPEGTRIAFSGGPSCNDHQHIWSALDRVHARHADMVLLHGATPTGAERAAACWADARKVPQVAFRPDWNRDKKAAPFKRNERLIDAMPAGLIVFSGTGIQDNLVDKARAFGIPVWDFRIREAP